MDCRVFSTSFSGPHLPPLDIPRRRIQIRPISGLNLDPIGEYGIHTITHSILPIFKSEYTQIGSEYCPGILGSEYGAKY